MAFKTHISNATGNQPGQVTGILTAIMSEGVYSLSRLDYKVTGTAGLAVSVAKGEAFVENDSYVYGTMDQRFFNTSSSVAESVTITANSSGNPRIDIIVIKIDTGASPGTQGVNSSSLIAVAGTPAGSPVAPATPSNCLLIAQVAVANGASSISNGNITDSRVQAYVQPSAIDPAGTYTVGTLNATTGAITTLTSTSATVSQALTASKGFTANLPNAVMTNGKISRTVASNNMTVALKTLAGTDPSATNPVSVRINNTIYTITAALGVTANAGTNWFGSGGVQFATNQVDYFVYLGVHSGSVFIGYATVPYATTYADLPDASTSPLYLVASVAPSATDPMVNIGRFNATLSATASFNWSVPATSVVIDNPIFETRVLTGLTGAGGFSATTVDAMSYKVIGDMLFTFCRIVGTSNATSFTYALRFVNVGTTGEGSGVGRDSGVSMPINLEVAAASSSVSVYRATVSGANVITTTTWTNSGDKRANGFLATPIR